MTTFCIEKEKLKNLSQCLVDTTIKLYQIDLVEAVYIVPYIIWKKYDAREMGEEGINIAYYAVLNDPKREMPEIDECFKELKSMRDKTGINILGISVDINLYGENNTNSYSRRINDNSIYNGEILFDKNDYIRRVKRVSLFEPGMIEYNNIIEFEPPLDINQIRSLVAK